MLGLIALLVIAVYVAVLIGATALGYRYGTRHGWTRDRRWAAAAVGFAIIFLPVFWDWLPVVWSHDYYCSKYGGLVVNKTRAQWDSENPDVVIKATRRLDGPHRKIGETDWVYYNLNDRFRWEVGHIERALGILEFDERIVDSKTGEVLAVWTTFSTGHSGGTSINSFRDIKIWMARRGCEPIGQESTRKTFNQIYSQFAEREAQR